jgi:hypothetical protein
MFVDVLNVGDGACSVVRGQTPLWPGEISIIDCGSWRSDGSSQAQQVSAALGQSLGRLKTIIVTHFDADHWWGLRSLAPHFARARADISETAEVQVLFPRMPDVARRLPAATLALITSVGGTGVRAMELLNAWEAVANVQRRALSRDDQFWASGELWHVHWPPAALPSAASRSVERALQDLEQLADNMAESGAPTLRKNLDEAYGSRDFFSPEANDELRFEDSPSGERPSLVEDLDFVGDDDDTPSGLGGQHSLLADDLVIVPEQFRERFRDVARRVGRANNYLSLVFESDGGQLLVLGDIQGWALRVVTHQLDNIYGMVLAPHHGTKPLPGDFPPVHLCVAQAGPEHFKLWKRHLPSHGRVHHRCMSTYQLGNIRWPREDPWCCGWCMHPEI